MSDLRKAAEMALGALNAQTPLDKREFELRNAAIEALRLALAQPEWVGLTDEEIKEIIGPWGDTPIKGYTRQLFDKIEAKLKEKNNG